MIELLGDFPKVMLSGKNSSQVFNRKGQLKRINKLRYWNLQQVLTEKYEFSKDEAEEIAQVILPMIKVVPKERYFNTYKELQQKIHCPMNGLKESWKSFQTHNSISIQINILYLFIFALQLQEIPIH